MSVEAGQGGRQASAGDTHTCLGYRSSASESKLFMFCFESGRLIDKKSF